MPETALSPDQNGPLQPATAVRPTVSSPATDRAADRPAPARSGAHWPGVPAHRHARAGEDLSAIDEQDTSAWAMPYTDLTMLLMVFFIVKLSLIDPNPPLGTPGGVKVEHTTAEDAAPRPGGQDGSGSMTPFDGGDGVLPGAQGLLAATPDRPPPGEQGTGGADAASPGDGAAPPASPPVDPWRTAQPAAPPVTDPADAFDAEWARRVRALESAAAGFLSRTGLDAQVQLVVSDVGIELRLPDELLFPSGSATMQRDGVELLSRLATLLLRLEGDIQISGHTDNVPIRTARFPSNWDLSAARAIEVVRLLRSLGVPETRMQAVGHGDNRPIASNASAEGRATNRRVTIDVTPRPAHR